jgi:hypothetical protein
VALQVTGHGEVGLTVELEPDQHVRAGFGVQGVVELERIDVDGGRLDLVAVDDPGDAAGSAQAPGGALAELGARLGVSIGAVRTSVFLAWQVPNAGRSPS